MHTLKRLRKLIGANTRRDVIARKTAKVFGENDEAYKKIMRACDLSRDTHRGKKRKNGEPVINHERAMYIIALLYLEIRDVDLLVAIFMHDMYEDYPQEWPLIRIAEMFGGETARLVAAVTKPPRSADLSNREHSQLIFSKVDAAGRKAWILKIIDRLHNMLTLYGDENKITRKIRQTYKYVIPRAIEYGVLAEELIMATEEQRCRLRRQGIKVFG